MKRLLCILGSMEVGGAETFLMKIYRTIDRTLYQMDFAVYIDGDGAYDDEIKSLGGKIYHITPKSKGMLRNFRDIKTLVKNGNYEYVLRISQNSLSALELLAAKFGGAKIRAFRSSNSNVADVSQKQLLVHQLCRFMPRFFANVRIAPSTEAADFMFGNDCIKKGIASILHNGVDLSLYRYDDMNRNEIRNSFNIDDETLLIGHIGRFSEQKNHMFLLDVFKQIHDINANTKLLLVGKGKLKEKVHNQVSRMSLEDSVIFAGERSDVPAILSAMDVFIMTSFYEGMPNTVIEAQATGLPCVIADTITHESDITGLVQFLSLNAPVSEWAKTAIGASQQPRKNTIDDFLTLEYDIKSVAKKFISLLGMDHSVFKTERH